MAKRRRSAIRIRGKGIPSEARRRRLCPTALRISLAASPAATDISAAEMAVGLQVTDGSLDGGAAAQFAFDAAEHAALLAPDEDAT